MKKERTEERPKERKTKSRRVYCVLRACSFIRPYVRHTLHSNRSLKLFRRIRIKISGSYVFRRTWVKPISFDGRLTLVSKISRKMLVQEPLKFGMPIGNDESVIWLTEILRNYASCNIMASRKIFELTKGLEAWCAYTVWLDDLTGPKWH